MKYSSDDFFKEMIEKLSILNEEISKHDFLADICRFFDISHAFIYESNPAGGFIRAEYFEVTDNNPLPERLNVKDLLGLELFSELCSKKVLICSGASQKSELEARLSSAFHLSTLVFIPILNQHYELAGFVGLGDRRKTARHAKSEINNACALLNLLGNAVKLEMFTKGIANTEAALGNVLDHIGIDIYVNDYYTHDVLYTNRSMAEPYGGVENLIGKKCWQALFSDKEKPCEFCPQPKLLDEHGRLNKTYQWDYERPFDHSWFRVLSSSFPWTDGRIAHLVASVDITESKKNQMLIEKLAQYDYLTGLANRRSMQDDIQLFIENHDKFGDKFFVLFCDLDGFKNVNDSHGHEAGDKLLIGIAHDLKELCGENIKAYRQGGDEFVVLIKDTSHKHLGEIIDNLFAIFRKRYDFNGADIGCGCSIGVACYPSDATNAKDIFRMADSAMYCAKNNNRGTVCFYNKGDLFCADNKPNS